MAPRRAGRQRDRQHVAQHGVDRQLGAERDARVARRNAGSTRGRRRRRARRGCCARTRASCRHRAGSAPAETGSPRWRPRHASRAHPRRNRAPGRSRPIRSETARSADRCRPPRSCAGRTRRPAMWRRPAARRERRDAATPGDTRAIGDERRRIPGAAERPRDVSSVARQAPALFGADGIPVAASGGESVTLTQRTAGGPRSIRQVAGPRSHGVHRRVHRREDRLRPTDAAPRQKHAGIHFGGTRLAVTKRIGVVADADEHGRPPPVVHVGERQSGRAREAPTSTSAS